jgi:hypothetical protein
MGNTRLIVANAEEISVRWGDSNVMTLGENEKKNPWVHLVLGNAWQIGEHFFLQSSELDLLLSLSFFKFFDTL